MKSDRSISFKGLRVLLRLGVGCLIGGAVLPSSAFAESEIIPTTTDTQALLGHGYAKDKELFKGECLEGVTVSQGLDQAILSFKQTISHDQLSNELGFGAAGRAKFGVVSTSAAAKFLSESKSNAFSISAIYSGDYQFKNLILSRPKVTALAQPFLRHDERWLAACGDEYVAQMKVGAKIFFNIRIDFSSQSDKKAFEANFNIKGPLWGASGEIKTAMNQFSERTQVTVSAFQVGGDIRELSEIFGDTQLFTKCSLGEFDKCSSVLASALEYATQKFPKKIRASSDNLGDAGSLAVLKYITKPYATAGVFAATSPMVRQEVQAARRTLDEYLTQFYGSWTLVRNALANPSRRLSERQSAQLQSMEIKLQEGRSRILDASQLCYDQPDMECVRLVKGLNPNLDSGLYQVRAADWVFENESFAQFCDEGLSPQSGGGLKASIDGILGYAKKTKPELFRSVVPGQNIDACFVAGTYLSRQRELDLSNLGLVDLSPLQEFTRLTSLNLSGNNISDLSVFANKVFGGFQSLTVLNLAKNQIRQVAHLVSLTALQVLGLNQNHVTDPSPLAPMNQMTRLDLRNNSREIRCPFNRPGVCLTTDLGRSGAFVISERSHRVPRYTPAIAMAKPGTRPELLVVGSLGGKAFGERYSSQDGTIEPIEGPRETRQFATATTLKDGSVLVAGGTGFDTALIYSPRRRFFAPVEGSMVTPRGAHTATLLNNGKVLITGGWTSPFNQVATQSVELFDPKQDKFKALPRGMSVPRAHHTATLLNDGTVLIIGGYNDAGSTPTADLFDPVTETITPILTTRMDRGRGAHQATLLPNGTVLITGGFDGMSALDDAELYLPETREFKRAPSSLHVKRGGHQATLLGNGLVLITGGTQSAEVDLRGDCQGCTATAEIFDPSTSEFEEVTSQMRVPRAYHAAAPIADGTVLVVGGVGQSAGLTADLFTYDVN